VYTKLNLHSSQNRYQMCFYTILQKRACIQGDRGKNRSLNSNVVFKTIKISCPTLSYKLVTFFFRLLGSFCSVVWDHAPSVFRKTVKGGITNWL